MSRFRWPSVLLTVGMILVVILAGCTRLPQSGPVGRSDQQEGGEAPASYIYNPPAPAEGATAEQVATGFINAGSGIQDDFATARKYMTDEAAENWNPEARTLIYSSQPAVVASDAENEFTVQFEIQGVVDEAGVHSQTSENSTEALTLSMTRVDGEWRVSEAPNGIVLDSSQFNALYASQRLFFYDPSFSYAVPDVRWFLNRSGQTAEIVQALMDGPAAYLDGAVASAFPAGSELSRPSVPVRSGAAEVDVSSTTLTDTGPLERQRMQQQLELTLSDLARISEVEMSVGLNPVDLGEDDPEFQAVEDSMSVGSLQVGVDESDQLVYYEGAAVLPVSGLADLGNLEPKDPTMSVDNSEFVFLNGSRTALYWANREGTVETLAEGEELIAPSLDHAGWSWTADRGADTTQINAVQRGDRRDVSAEWLQDRQIQALRVSPDGARVALVVGDDDGGNNELYIAGVVRDSDGAPLAIGSPISMDTSVPINDVVWYSTSELLVAATSDTERVVPELVGLNGSHTSLNPLLGLTGFSAGAGSSTIYAETGEEVMLRVGSWWRPQSGVAHDLSFPG